MRALRCSLALGAVFAVAFGLRLASWPAIFSDDGLYPYGTDAYYHLRRIEYSLAHFPSVLQHDRYLNHPHGGDVIWPPGFDWSVALLLRLGLGASPGRPALERAAMFVPPLLGALTAVGVAWLARRRWGELAGWIAGGVLALMPAHVAYSRLGMLDHHVAVALCGLALLALAMAVLRSCVTPAPGTSQRWLAWSAGFGAAIAAAFAVWPGCLLHLALVDAALLGVFVATRERRTAFRVACGFALSHALAAAALAPLAFAVEWQHWGPFSPVVLSGFQPWLLGCAAGVGIGCAAFTRVPRLDAAAPRLAALAVLVGVLGGLSAWVLTDLGRAAAEIWSWLARQEAFQAQVVESLPLFSRRAGAGAAESASWLLFLFPVALVLYAERLRARSGCADGWPLLSLGLGLLLAALLQRRFANSLAVPLALLSAWLIARELPRQARARWSSPRTLRAVHAGLAAATLLLLAPTAIPQVRRVASISRPPARLPWPVERRHMLHRLAEWMRENTPPTSGYHDSRASPEYGVLAHWTNGHALEYVAQRPTVVSNFGDDVGPENMQLVARYFQAAEPEASALLDRLGARYALIEVRDMPLLQHFGPGSMLARLYFGDGAAARSSVRSQGGTRERVAGRFPALARHRLVYESRPRPGRARSGRPAFKLYEHVPGVVATGRAEPGAVVEARLAIVSNRVRRFEWVDETRADADGRWQLRLPYATRGAPRGVVPEPFYRITSGARSARLAVDEASLWSGARIEVPTLAGEPEAG